MANQADPPEVMTSSTWLAKVLLNKDALRTLVATYHPMSNRTAGSMVITAPNAEAACQRIRDKIKLEEANKGEPAIRFDEALAKADVDGLLDLLESVWIGVPESTECWSIPGFDVACDLLDDPPREGE